MRAPDYRLLFPALRSRACLRCREREPKRLQLRVVLCPDEAGYEVVVDETDAQVEVLVLVCDDGETGGEPTTVPCTCTSTARSALGRSSTDHGAGRRWRSSSPPGRQVPRSAPGRIRTCGLRFRRPMRNRLQP